ncbi:MAG TPA: Rv3235 family protein [Mycobacteriales bacterium]|nr:Rv3235 family protein [Mycobacteriales bacterium]
MTASVIERRPLLRIVPVSAPRTPPSWPRVRRAPILEPPYDDEYRDWPLWHGPHADELPFEEPAPRHLTAEPDYFDPQPTTRKGLPDPEPWAARLIQAALEILVGRRPAGQLQEWTTALVHAELLLAAKERQWAVPGGSPPGVRSVHVSEPASGVAEVCAVVQRGERYFAVAARLEGLDGRWRCVKIQLG